MDGLKIALIGDLNIRVMHALPLVLAQYDTHLYTVLPEELSMPQNWFDEFSNAGLNYVELENLEGILHKLDVIYLMGTKTPSYAIGHTDSQNQDRPQTPKACIIDAKN